MVNECYPEAFMRKLLFTAAMLLAPLAQADVSFAEYEAATEATATHSRLCKSELRASGEPHERCARFYEYLDRYEVLSDSFRERMTQEGIQAFDGASDERLSKHMIEQDQLTADLRYITAMTY